VKTFLVTIGVDAKSMEGREKPMRIAAGSWKAAVSRGIRQFQKRLGGNGLLLHIHVVAEK
jgi:hypothetical protein